jgi:hypothetical protein
MSCLLFIFYLFSFLRFVGDVINLYVSATFVPVDKEEIKPVEKKVDSPVISNYILYYLTFPYDSDLFFFFVFRQVWKCERKVPWLRKDCVSDGEDCCGRQRRQSCLPQSLLALFSLPGKFCCSSLQLSAVFLFICYPLLVYDLLFEIFAISWKRFTLNANCEIISGLLLTSMLY